jgi:protein-tyrosine phosphatase
MKNDQTRNLTWRNCLNVRDLGGLRTRTGTFTKYRSLVRADEIDRLTPQGLATLKDHGICTIIDLRDDRERKNAFASGTADLEWKHVPLEDQSDELFWGKWREYNCTPFYYEAFMEQSPARIADVFVAIADAESGGVVFHCGRGRDRTGLISILLLALAHVEPAEVAADYQLSEQNLISVTGEVEARKINELFARHQTTPDSVIHQLLKDFDVEKFLIDSGVREDQLARIRSRLV